MQINKAFSILFSLALFPISCIADIGLSEAGSQVAMIKLREPASDVCIDDCEEEPALCEPAVFCDPSPRWYFEAKPGYFYFTDASMRRFYGDGGFTMRGELGYKVRGPLIVFLDGGYFQKEGSAIGSNLKTDILLGTMTLGLKGVFSLHEVISVYAGAGPRLFMVMMHNQSPYVRGDDNAIGIGGGFNGGVFIYPIPQYRNVFFDLFVDYSLKTLKIDEDEISSYDYDVDVSGISAGIGLGIRF